MTPANESTNNQSAVRTVQTAVVLRVREDVCEVATDGGLRTVRYANHFPTPRIERVSPGHLVAIASAPRTAAAVIWRWYDGVVLGSEDGLIRLWEPSHGEVLARPRTSFIPSTPGARAYLSAGLPGADWWVAGPAPAVTGYAAVDLDDVERLYTEHNLWDDASG